MKNSWKNLLNLAETILKEEEEIIIPIYKLYELITQEKEEVPELDQFITLVANDSRFVIMESKSTQEPWSDDEDEAMKSLGFYRGPRIFLKERKPSKEAMLQILQEKMQNTLDALNSLYGESFNDLSAKDEKQLIHIISKTKDLQKKIDKSFSEKDSYEK